MFHNLHSQFHVLKMALLHFQHIHFSHVGKAGVTHARSPACLPLPSPHLIILHDESSGYGISGVYNLVFIGTCRGTLGQTLALALPVACGPLACGPVSWRSAATPHPLWTQRGSGSRCGVVQGSVGGDRQGMGMPHRGGTAAWAELKPEPEARNFCLRSDWIISRVCSTE